jgi:hypothetical protein
MLGLSIIKTKELERFNNLEYSYKKILYGKNEQIRNLENKLRAVETQIKEFRKGF